jgi:hypothetical protein
MCQFAFLVDIINHLNELNAHLQGIDQLMDSMFDHINACRVKLHLWKSQIRAQTFVHFLTLLKCNVRNFEENLSMISKLREQYESRFQDFKKNCSGFGLFLLLFQANINEVLEKRTKNLLISNAFQTLT